MIREFTDGRTVELSKLTRHRLHTSHVTACNNKDSKLEKQLEMEEDKVIKMVIKVFFLVASHVGFDNWRGLFSASMVLRQDHSA